MLTDPVADYLTRVRNAIAADHDEVVVPASRLRLEITRILKEQGYIDGYAVEPARIGEAIRIQLKYVDGRHSAISQLQRVSKPGRRHYVRADEVPRVLGGMGTAIVSTSNGLMTGHDARRAGVGGEVLAYVQ